MINTKALLHWLTLVGVGTIVIAFAYVGLQQNLRQGANDPQIQISDDLVAALSAGVNPFAILAQAGSIDISKSLAPFVAIYDDKGNLVGSSAVLNGAAPKVPSGVLEYAKQHEEDRITWQPQKGVRAAIIVRSYQSSVATSSGYVVTGRSLREVEKRESQLGYFALLSWIGVVIFSFLTILASDYIEKKKMQI